MKGSLSRLAIVIFPLYARSFRTAFVSPTLLSFLITFLVSFALLFSNFVFVSNGSRLCVSLCFRVSHVALVCPAFASLALPSSLTLGTRVSRLALESHAWHSSLTLGTRVSRFALMSCTSRSTVSFRADLRFYCFPVCSGTLSRLQGIVKVCKTELS